MQNSQFSSNQVYDEATFLPPLESKDFRDPRLQQCAHTILERWIQCNARTTQQVAFPSISYVQAILENIDPEENSPPRYCFCWQFPGFAHTLRLYIDTEHILISDPQGSLFAKTFHIEDLGAAVGMVFAEVQVRQSAKN